MLKVTTRLVNKVSMHRVKHGNKVSGLTSVFWAGNMR